MFIAERGEGIFSACEKIVQQIFVVIVAQGSLPARSSSSSTEEKGPCLGGPRTTKRGTLRSVQAVVSVSGEEKIVFGGEKSAVEKK